MDTSEDHTKWTPLRDTERGFRGPHIVDTSEDHTKWTPLRDTERGFRGPHIVKPLRTTQSGHLCVIRNAVVILGRQQACASDAPAKGYQG